MRDPVRKSFIKIRVNVNSIDLICRANNRHASTPYNKIIIIIIITIIRFVKRQNVKRLMAYICYLTNSYTSTAYRQKPGSPSCGNNKVSCTDSSHKVSLFIILL